MRIIDSYEDILGLINLKPFNLETWRTYANQVCEGLAVKCEGDVAEYDFGNDVIPVINALYDKRDALEVLHSIFLEVVDSLSTTFDKHGLVEPDVDIVFYLGLCNGAGWATKINKRNVVLLGVEKILELGWDNPRDFAALIYHELGHIWHEQNGRYDIAQNQRERSILQLYQEGVAMYFEQLLCGDMNFYHQDKNGWLNWCASNEDIIKKEYLHRINTEKSTQEFFGDWCKFHNHSDVGYYLGCEFVKYLIGKHTIDRAVRLEACELIMDLKLYAIQIL
ncbi:hypothetical protein [Paenibacillus marinisediminis]